MFFALEEESFPVTFEMIPGSWGLMEAREEDHVEPLNLHRRKNKLASSLILLDLSSGQTLVPSPTAAFYFLEPRHQQGLNEKRHHPPRAGCLNWARVGYFLRPVLEKSSDIFGSHVCLLCPCHPDDRQMQLQAAGTQLR